MVNRRHRKRKDLIRTAIATVMLCHTALYAQDFPTSDTTTEYPHKGTFYHDRFEGRKTSSGEIFDQNKFTAAHWKIKLGTMIMVTNYNTDKQVILKVNDRCPKEGIIDMSHRGATAVGIRGSQPVTVRILPPGYEAAWAAQETMFDSVSSTLNDVKNPAAGPAGGKKNKKKKNAAKKETPANIAKKEPTKKTEVKQEKTQQKPSKTKAQQRPNTTKPKPQTKPQEAISVSEPRYNLVLGYAANHGEAFTMIERLPEEYRDAVEVEETENGKLLLTLHARLTKTKAEEMCRSLKGTFKGIHKERID